jgi:hypothetical protein
MKNRRKMKKSIYLFLGIFSLNAVFLQAQVRIGSSQEPHPSAVLDLNETDRMDYGTLGLALPRVVLTSNTTPLNSSNPPDGMIVYNTNKTLGEGIYYWKTDKWIKLANGSYIDNDAIVGNEVTGATPNRGLIRSGRGTADSTYTLGIDKEGVKNDMIAKGAVTGDKINNMNASKDHILYFDGVTWRPESVNNITGGSGSGSGSRVKIQFVSETLRLTSSPGTRVIKIDKVENLNKTFFVLNGHSGKERFPMYISEFTENSVTIPATSPSTTGYSLQVVEFK